jgi:hypothetical protein
VAKKRRLTDIPLNRLADAQQQALLRLHLAVTGKMHAVLGAFHGKVRARLLESATAGKIAPEKYYTLISYAQDEWKKTSRQIGAVLAKGMGDAAAIPFGVMARAHDDLFTRAALPLNESTLPSPFFEQMIAEVLEAAMARIYGDGLKLSGRLWNLDQRTLAGLRATLYTSITTGRSAYETASDLEQFLGYGAACPRWTRARLKLTKTQIAGGDKSGLVPDGNDCASKGVAYHALRLIRNEMQIVHHAATDKIYSKVPWVTEERIYLSSSHGKTDECDTIASGGERSNGTYPKGTITLPLHVGCLCYKGAVLESPEAFADRLRGWMESTEDWPEMDQYALYLNASKQDLSALRLGMQMGNTLLTWLWGGEQGLLDMPAEL